MKKNKFLIALLAALMSCSFAIGFTSCKDDDDSSSGGINSERPKDDDGDDGSTGGGSSDGGSEDDGDDDESTGGGSSDDGDDEECEHDWLEKDKIEATCTQDGKVIYKCKDCKEEREETIPATGHDLEEGYECPNCEYKEYSKGLNYALRTDDEGNEYYAVTDKGVCQDLIVIIPAYYEGKPVKEIAAHAFDQGANSNYQKDIEVLGFVFPATLERIGTRAFYGSKAVEIVNLSQLPIEKVGTDDEGRDDHGMAGYYIDNICKSKSEAKLIKHENGCIVFDTEKAVLDENGEYTYDENDEIITAPYQILLGFEGEAEEGEDLDVVVPDGVQEIAVGVFRDKKVTSVTMPDSVEAIDDYAFANSALATVNGVENWEIIIQNVFYGTAISDLSVFASIKEIQSGAFQNCPNLPAIFEIPETVEFIAGSAFADNAFVKVTSTRAYWTQTAVYFRAVNG